MKRFPILFLLILLTFTLSVPCFATSELPEIPIITSYETLTADSPVADALTTPAIDSAQNTLLEVIHNDLQNIWQTSILELFIIVFVCLFVFFRIFI